MGDRQRPAPSSALLLFKRLNRIEALLKMSGLEYLWALLISGMFLHGKPSLSHTKISRL